ncbi:sialidase family protein [Streptomyces goshikiensis]|uniref:hypothetical protein n=1 Tax=Streptomyces goshikiensis TaxID=1942 RepID=UPI00371AED91
MPSPAPQVPGGQRRFPRPARLCGLSLGLLAATALTLAPSPATEASATEASAATAPTATAGAATASAAENPVPAVVSTPFAAGADGYHCTRIPALVTTRSGALLAFAEGRVRGSEGCGDVGDNDIVMKKSTDGGATWGPLKVLVGAGTDKLTHGNPAPVVDAVTGRITEFSAPAPADDITPPGQFNIHVGARPDFPNQATGVKELFNGGLDDVRLFGRALTRAESARVRAGATDIATDVATGQERLRLAFGTTG